MLSVDGFPSERPDSSAGNKKTAADDADESERGGKSPSRKLVGKAVAGGLLLMPRLRVSSRRQRRQERAAAKSGGSGSGSSANEVSRSNSFKFERYGGAASPEGAEAGATTGGSLLQRKVGSDETFGHFTICDMLIAHVCVA